MPRNNPYVTISGMVLPKSAEVITHLAKANRCTRSEMVRILIEEALVARAEESMASEYDRLENRLRKIEKRFSALIVKGVRASAQNLYFSDAIIRQYKISRQDRDELWKASKQFAGEWLQKASGDDPTERLEDRRADVESDMEGYELSAGEDEALNFLMNREDPKPGKDKK